MNNFKTEEISAIIQRGRDESVNPEIFGVIYSLGRDAENDEEYSRIISSVDLEYIKDVAINQLGMRYAEEGQIVEVETQGDDYVRQHQEMP